MASTTSQQQTSARLQAETVQFVDVRPGHPLRARAEQFICDKYWFTFSACLAALPEQLICLCDDTGDIVAACAFSIADHRKLFSERYLGHPVQEHIETVFLTRIQRQRIAEIGSLACLNHTYLPMLFAAVVDYASQHNVDFLLFTATAQLRRHLQRLQLPTQILANAPAVALPEAEREQWGKYYDRQPLVLAGRTQDGVRLQHHLQRHGAMHAGQ